MKRTKNHERYAKNSRSYRAGKKENPVILKKNACALVEGTIEGTSRGYAFCVPKDGGEDFFISEKDLCGAEHKDTVLVQPIYQTKRRQTARVEKILSRGQTEVVGTFYAGKRGGKVASDDKKYYSDVFVAFGLENGAKTGDKVVCRILTYPHGDCPQGEISEVLGRSFDRRTEVRAVCVAKNIEIPFSKDVLREAEGLMFSEKDTEGRADFRKTLTFTVDGEDAKDFDDAISVCETNGGFTLGVHIADVSEYVKRGTALDDAAFSRGTSVYFPELVVPMLPEKLCNDLCSLLPCVDRLTFSVVMEIGKNGEVKSSKITPSVIRSSARLTYRIVSDFLKSGEKVFEKAPALTDSVLAANKLCDLLIEKREKRGSIDLDVKESDVRVVDGKILLREHERTKAHRIIEEFMILANETVAKFCEKNRLPILYRTHDLPSEEKEERFTSYLQSLGIKWNATLNRSPLAYEGLLKSVREKDEVLYPLVNRMMLRSMMKAKYTTENFGHFGLASNCYCHFTSPIRRYPDLFVHRVMKAFLRGENTDKFSAFSSRAANETSERERNAETAERDVDDFYKLLYLSNYVGKTFTGVISGITSFGLYVELPSTAEGFVPVRELFGYGYKYDEKKMTLSNGIQSYRLGDKMNVLVAEIDFGEKKAIFLPNDRTGLAKKQKIK